MQNSIGSYVFQEPRHLQDALRHPSSGVNTHFQRLEFMGDSVLSLVVTDALMDAFPQESEGSLSKRRASLVSREVCQQVGESLGLTERISVGVNVDLQNSSIIADAIEAVLGAIFIDSKKDLRICEKWILEQWGPLLRHSHPKPPPIDPKTALQEWTQSRKLCGPVYTETSREGPDHNLVLSVSVSVPGLNMAPASGTGRTKKAAEKEAAKQLMAKLVHFHF